MELEEFRTTWREMDQKLSATIAIQRDLQRDIRVDRTKRSLGKFIGLPICELVVGLITALVSGGFLVRNFDHATFFGSFSGTAIFLLGALTVVLSIWQLELIGSLDYSGPVVEIQRKLAKITRIRIKSALWLMALLTPIWFVFPIFALQLLAGYPGYLPLSAKLAEVLKSAWMIGNIAVGFALVAAIYLIVRWKGSKVKWTKVLSEYSLADAAGHLAEIEEFEKNR
jgi:hypothetical protein